jgi:hypothetical protein
VLNQLYLHFAFLDVLFCIESLFSDGLGILACAVVGEDGTWLHPIPLVPVDVLPKIPLRALSRFGYRSVPYPLAHLCAHVEHLLQLGISTVALLKHEAVDSEISVTPEVLGGAVLRLLPD